MLVSLLLAAVPAHAGHVDLTRGGAPGLYVFVDGEAKGKLTKKEPMSLDVEDGKHELWFSWDDDAVSTVCHGTVDVKGTFAWEVAPIKQGCDQLTNEIPVKTAFKGAFLDIEKANGDTNVYSTDIDGLGRNEGLKNVTPGQHTVIVNMGAGTDRHQVCMGMVTLEAGQTRKLLLSQGQCAGFDNEVHIVR